MRKKRIVFSKEKAPELINTKSSKVGPDYLVPKQGTSLLKNKSEAILSKVKKPPMPNGDKKLYDPPRLLP